MHRLIFATCSTLLATCLFAQVPDQTQAKPREAEATAVATTYLELVDAGNADESFAMFANFARPSSTLEEWNSKLRSDRVELGTLKRRSLKRIVWYQDPPSAPFPGTYAAVEFDSVYANADKHFRYVMLHSRNGEPFRVTLDYSARALTAGASVVR